MPTEFVRQIGCYDYHGLALCDSTKLVIAYDASGHRISKTRMKESQNGTWWTELVTHYMGIGTEIRENPVNHEAKVVMNMPNGLGRYEPEDAAVLPSSSRTFEWYLKNHLGSTMLVYASGYGTPGVVRAAYDYRAFGEQVTLTESADKVTENFTGKEKDDETELNYFGARYLDPMLGMWTSVDPKRQFASPYLYAGNGYNPVNVIDPDGNTIYILLSNELNGGMSKVNKFEGGRNVPGQQSAKVPLYNMYVGNSSGNAVIVPVTRDAIAGKGAFSVDGIFSGKPRVDELENGGYTNYRIELQDLETGSPTILDGEGRPRTNIQIHSGPGCSKGCSIFQTGSKKFETLIKRMMDEDGINGYDNDIIVETETFEPSVSPDDFK